MSGCLSGGGGIGPGDVSGGLAVDDYVAPPPILRPGFILRVTAIVSGVREEEGAICPISRSGKIDLPMIGPWPAVGMTAEQLAEELVEPYRRYYRDARFQVEFVVDPDDPKSIPWGHVLVLGRVKTPGKVHFGQSRELTLREALLAAGGFDSSAKAKAVRVVRSDADGNQVKIQADLRPRRRVGAEPFDMYLRPGDVVWVPESIF